MSQPERLTALKVTFGEIVEPADASVMPKMKLVLNSEHETSAGAWVEGVRWLC
jgi:hypothetical protein